MDAFVELIPDGPAIAVRSLSTSLIPSPIPMPASKFSSLERPNTVSRNDLHVLGVEFEEFATAFPLAAPPPNAFPKVEPYV